jgi:hypothetical protein
MLVTNCTIRLSADMGLRASDVGMSRVCISHLLTNYVIIGASARLCWRKRGKDRDRVMSPLFSGFATARPDNSANSAYPNGNRHCSRYPIMFAVVGLGLSGRRQLAA